MYPRLTEYINNLEHFASEISSDRKKVLKKISGYVTEKRDQNESTKLIFICTHNSRRSHFCQVWSAVLAEYLGLANIETYSGGTEATALHPNAVGALKRSGFEIENPGGENPRYKIYFDENEEPLICFSKTFDDPANPQENFAAVMTCSDADENCPFVPGAERRISLPYQDPKQADGTPQEKETYDERCRQIATEMWYLMSQTS